MRPIEQIATDVFNGVIPSPDEQAVFVLAYGPEASVRYGLALPQGPAPEATAAIVEAATEPSIPMPTPPKKATPKKVQK